MKIVNYQNILIIKPGAMGDLLQMTPVFRALKERFPGCRITLMTGSAASDSMFRPLWSVDDLMVFDKKGEHRSLASLFALRRKIRRRKFDLVLNFQRSNVKAWLLASAALPCRVLVYHKARKRTTHAVRNHLETLAPLGIDMHDLTLEFNPGSEAEMYAGRLFEAEGLIGGTVIALNPGASHPVNRWSTDRFARLADMLAEKLAARVIIVGGKDDVALAEEIAAKANSFPLVLTGKTSLLQLGAVLRKCTLLVSGDTGPMHMATAVGTRVAALFGAADPARTGPVGSGHRVIQARGIDCVPCLSRRCASSRHLDCMEKIEVEEVFHTIAAMLAEKDSRP